MDDQPIYKAIRPQLRFKATEDEFDALPDEVRQHVKYINGNCFIELPITNGDVVQLEPDVLIEFLKTVEVIPTVVVTEFGGFDPDQNFGIGQTVCGVSGRPLFPFFSCDTVHRDHALFGVPQKVMLCRAHRRSDTRLSLTLWDVKLDYWENGCCQLRVVQYWNGSRFNEAPRRYQTALVFALAKAVTPNCSGPAYYGSSKE